MLKESCHSKVHVRVHINIMNPTGEYQCLTWQLAGTAGSMSQSAGVAPLYGQALKQTCKTVKH